MTNRRQNPNYGTLIPEMPKRSHLDFISEHWDLLAACAWKSYRACGRVALSLVPSPEAGGDWRVLVCVPLNSRLSHHWPKMKDYNIESIKNYDPLKEIVVLFEAGTNIVAYRGEGLAPEHLAPPVAYKKVSGLIKSHYSLRRDIKKLFA